MTLDQFKANVESFIAASGMTATEFGKQFASDPSFVFELRTGREPREATRAKVLEAIASSNPDRAAREGAAA